MIHLPTKRDRATTVESLLLRGIKTLETTVEERTCRECGSPFLASFVLQFVCATCVQAHDRRDAQLRRQEVLAERERRLVRMGLDDTLAGMTFMAFVADEQPPAYDAARRFVANWPNRGLVLWGPTGAGKTFLACAALLALADLGIEGNYLNLVEATARLRRSSEWQLDANRILTPLHESPAVVLDDVGREKSSDALVEQIDALINHRWVVGKPTILTTNLTPEDLFGDGKTAGWLSNAAASRIAANLEVEEMRGPDRRLTGLRPLTSRPTPMADPLQACPTCQGAGWLRDGDAAVGKPDRCRRCDDCCGRGW